MSETRALRELLDNGLTSRHVADHLYRGFLDAGYTDGLPEEGGRSDRGVVRHEGLVIAAHVPGTASRTRPPLVMVAHTDSPGLVLKVRSTTRVDGGLRVPVELYGSPIERTWLDREVRFAGVSVEGSPAAVRTFETPGPVGIIPSVASHLVPRAERDQRPDAQRDMAVFVPARVDDRVSPSEALLRLVAALTDTRLDAARGVSLVAVPAERAVTYGTDPILVSSGRLDNLIGCYAICAAMISASRTARRPVVSVFFDHEEIGSNTAHGARGERAARVVERTIRSLDGDVLDGDRGMLVSVDGAHAVNPNRPDRHDPGYAPRMGGGPVVKESAVLRYAGDPLAIARFESAAEAAGIPLQWYRNRSDHVAGATVGPHVAARLGLPAIDVGVAILGMHSVRESAAVSDIEGLVAALGALAEDDT